MEPPYVGHLFIGAGDLVTDPRLGSGARKLVEGGLPAALQIAGEAALVSLAAGSFARSVQAGASAVGQARAKELLAGAPSGHAGAAAALFALGQGELPKDQLPQWKKLLEETCEKNRRAPAAAKRMGLAPQWPPNLPEAFAPLLQEAEKKTADVKPADAVANPSALKKPVGAVVAPGRALPKLSDKAPEKPPEKTDGKTLAPAIKRSPFRRPIGSVVEVPKTQLPPKPMQEVKGRPTSSTIVPEPQRPHIEPKEEGVTPKTIPGLARLPARDLPDVRFDPKGNRIPRADRWEDDKFQWQEPLLPSSEMPVPKKVAAAAGPFTQRVQSLFEDRPEAVDRLCAAAEARAAVGGEEKMLQDLGAELSRKRWNGKRAPREQLVRLRAVASDERQPAPWRSVAKYLLETFSVPGSGVEESS